jgi:hypothetical protein
MDYKTHYLRLIEKRREFPLTRGSGTERHLIVPTGMGGITSPENLIVLTTREHYIAHLLLGKIHPDRKIRCRGWGMNGKTSRKYVEFKKDLSEKKMGWHHSPESKKKLSASKLGRKRKPFTQETKDRMHASQQLRRRTEESEGFDRSKTPEQVARMRAGQLRRRLRDAEKVNLAER